MLIPSECLRATYRSMVEARCCDAVESSMIRQGLGAVHLGGEGAEINALLNCFLVQQDRLSLHWRDRALRLARGMSLEALAAGFYSLPGTEGSGRPSTCHESSRPLGILPIATPAGSWCLPACGAAWDQLLQRRQLGTDTGLTVCSIGDGTTRQGEVLEAIAFALEWKLPLLFVVIDNAYAISTTTAGRTAIDLGLIPRAIIHACEGWDPPNCLSTYRSAVEAVRSGGGPRLLHLKTPRLESHTSNDDQRIYRSVADIKASREHDPLPAIAEWLLQNNVMTADDMARIQGNAMSSVRDTYEALARQKEEHSKTFTQPVGDAGFHQSPLGASGHPPPTVFTRLRDSVNGALRTILQSHGEAMLLGQDVEDPLGGVFRLTQGLSNDFPGRVVNSPLAEATILGVGCGLATGGRLAIAEIQFIDFIAPGWNQLVTNIATQQWRTAGEWNCPLIIYAPADGYCPGEGIWHSQVNASQFSRNSEVLVAMPSNPVDAWNCFLAASERKGPSLILLPKALLWRRFSDADIASLSAQQPAEGKARTLTTGGRLTIVAWGNATAIASRVIESLDECDIELIDACYLNPIDYDTIFRSVDKTKRLIVIDAEHDGASIGNCIGFKVGQTVAGVSVQVLHRKTQYLGCGAWHERETLIGDADVLNAIRSFSL